MDENQKKLIEDQMKRIPSEVRMAIESSGWERKIFNIGRAHKLHIDDIDVLSVETILTMIGLEHPKDFFDNVQKRADVSDETLMDIVEEVNEQLFMKIRDALKNHYEKVSAGEIMADEDKDELFYAGIDIDDNRKPMNPKKNIETLVDKKPKPPEAKAVADVVEAKPETTPEPSEEKSVKLEVKSEPKIEIKEPEKPKLTFDPYREPIE